MDIFSIHGTVKAPSRRTISLAPSITELLFYLSMGDSLVGVTRQCDYPAAARDIENIGSFLIPDIKRIAELSPDNIIGLSNLHKHVPETLRDEHVGVILLDYHNVQGFLDSMEGISSLAIETKTALELVALLRHRVNVLRMSNNNDDPLRTLFLISESPIMIPSRNSYQYDALQISGAAQMPMGNTQYERVTMEEVVHFDPEIILSCGRHRGEPLPKMCPDCHSANPICQRIVDDIALQPKWEKTSAALNGNIIALPCHWLCRPGPRLIDGMESIAKILQHNENG